MRACCRGAAFDILGGMWGRAICLLALLSPAVPICLAPGAAADEIRLKDGSKILGTIVGYEDNSFKVQTSYGFALVRKDKVAAIIPTEPKPEAKKGVAGAKKPAPAEAAESAATADKLTPVQGTQTAQATPPAATSAAETVAPPASVPAAAVSPKKGVPPPAAAEVNAAQSAATPASTTQAPPSPPPNREEVQGNLYITHAYGFRMFKPPSWHVFEGAQKTLPTAIVAMGTGDETTLLVIGRDGMKDSLDAQAAATERQLRDIYTNYRRLSEQRTQIAGLAAVQRRYRGTVDGHDWSGVVLSLARGNEVFTILGMTYADSDLIQIQENVIAKAIASLEFTSR